MAAPSWDVFRLHHDAAARHDFGQVPHRPDRDGLGMAIASNTLAGICASARSAWAMSRTAPDGYGAAPGRGARPSTPPAGVSGELGRQACTRPPAKPEYRARRGNATHGRIERDDVGALSRRIDSLAAGRRCVWVLDDRGPKVLARDTLLQFRTL
jgi:hypothetical protein